ncbi:hypothetical protein M413DRAFT_282578 [Hebeloma cylindrosporum]|uniref:Uncharacterized protein n=1 Tax=Hebeloma cylindrosporum TaxID=76867 RepID=A0A0C3BJN5_HEBCY|nr:hypothetical protein M413DRAFT_282578 [Hebeloma cylindrosporum h7]
MVSGRSGPTYRQVCPTIPPIIPQGKRQVPTLNDYNSTTGLVNAEQMEEEHLRVNASYPSSSSGITSVSREWAVGSTAGISHSGSSDVGGHGNIYGGIEEEESPPAYEPNTGESASRSTHLPTMGKR